MSEPMWIFPVDDPDGPPDPHEIVPEDDRWCPLPSVVLACAA